MATRGTPRRDNREHDRQITTGFVPIVTEAVPVATVPHTPAPVIEVRLAGAVVRVASGVDDAAQLTVVLRAVRASASKS